MRDGITPVHSVVELALNLSSNDSWVITLSGLLLRLSFVPTISFLSNILIF